MIEEQPAGKLSLAPVMTTEREEAGGGSGGINICSGWEWPVDRVNVKYWAKSGALICEQEFEKRYMYRIYFG